MDNLHIYQTYNLHFTLQCTMWITIRLQIKLVQQISFLQLVDKVFEISLNT